MMWVGLTDDSPEDQTRTDFVAQEVQRTKMRKSNRELVRKPFRKSVSFQLVFVAEFLEQKL